jgi:hypothetical protein
LLNDINIALVPVETIHKYFFWYYITMHIAFFGDKNILQHSTNFK